MGEKRRKMQRARVQTSTSGPCIVRQMSVSDLESKRGQKVVKAGGRCQSDVEERNVNAPNIAD